MEFKKLSAGTIYKHLTIGALIGSLPVGLLFGISSMFDMSSIKLNETPVIGVMALVVAPLFLFFVSIFFITLIVLGLWIYSRVNKTKVYYYRDENS
ncbi:hypothetical protein [Aliivibrio fischeri]|uniref:hypothetical protein n=1 Tax=Aliivibrio fischeri TaxID=668 RepID=UPI00080DF6E9|nr:hypothetical protein [Aliivibrio fischeri]OCH08166.1 hypothetical protein A6E10_19380 [Aliivibrio fischeri]OCH29948.1 hypothetical protein A6E13_19165 [Aliivibrio fischeri]